MSLDLLNALKADNEACHRLAVQTDQVWNNAYERLNAKESLDLFDLSQLSHEIEELTGALEQLKARRRIVYQIMKAKETAA